MEYYQLVQYSFVFLTLLCLALILIGLNKALVYANNPSRKKIVIYTVTSLSLWIGILAAMSLSGFLSDFSSVPPRVFIVLIVPLITLILLLRFGKLSSLLKVIPPEWLINIQVFRFFVEILLWLLFLDELLPVQMTIEGRNFDILAGLTAINVGVLCFTKERLNKRVAIIWNFFGLALLSNIVITAILSFPTPFRVFMNEPANTIVAQFPIVLLPGILVPIAYWMHIFSLKQLMSVD